MHFMAGEVFVPFARGADADFDPLSDPQAEIADQVGAEVDVIRTGAEAALRVPQHGEVFLGLLEHAFADQTDALVAVETEQFVNQLALGDAALDPGGRGLGHRLQFGERFEAELVDVDGNRDGRNRCGGQA